MITDEQQLVKVTNQWGREIETYDDGFGPLWVFCQSWGVVGVVRADSRESAYEIVEDDILTPIAEEEVIEAYGYYTVPKDSLDKNNRIWYAHREGNLVPLAEFLSEKDAHTFCEQQIAAEEPELFEGYSYQSNATGTGIVQHDLNGETLEQLTPELVALYALKLEIEDID